MAIYLVYCNGRGRHITLKWESIDNFSINKLIKSFPINTYIIELRKTTLIYFDHKNLIRKLF